MHDTNGDDQAKRDARKRTARVPGDSADGVPTYDLRRLVKPIANITINSTGGSPKTVQIFPLGIDAQAAIALRTKEAQETDDDDSRLRLMDAFRAAVRQCVHGATEDELGALTEEQVGHVLVIASRVGTSLAPEDNSGTAEPARQAPRKARR